MWSYDASERTSLFMKLGLKKVRLELRWCTVISSSHATSLAPTKHPLLYPILMNNRLTHLRQSQTPTTGMMHTLTTRPSTMILSQLLTDPREPGNLGKSYSMTTRESLLGNQ